MTDTETQPHPLLEATGTVKPRKVRKKRIDAGRRRKADPTEYERSMSYFASLDEAGKQQFIRDCKLVLQFCDPAFRKAYNDYMPPAERLKEDTKEEIQKAAAEMRADMYGENGNG
jgi:hypothetical protein